MVGDKADSKTSQSFLDGGFIATVWGSIYELLCNCF